MIKTSIEKIKILWRQSPLFFIFSLIVLGLYGLQMLIKTEITPLGYFSLYSDPAFEQTSYAQNTPVKGNEPINIYNLRGERFLMMEILPTRYEILANSDHCNQMQHKLKRMGFSDNNCCDCNQLRGFNTWFKEYAFRSGVDTIGFELKTGYFKNGKIIKLEHVKDSAIFK